MIFDLELLLGLFYIFSIISFSVHYISLLLFDIFLLYECINLYLSYSYLIEPRSYSKEINYDFD